MEGGRAMAAAGAGVAGGFGTWPWVYVSAKEAVLAFKFGPKYRGLAACWMR
jgi:hypothetical protein